MTTLVAPVMGRNASEASFSLLSSVRVFESPESRAQQRIRTGNPLWRVRADYRDLDEESVRSLDAFLSGIEGRVNTFYFGPYQCGYARRLGSGGGAPVVNGASQTGTSLATGGWTPETTVLRKGDFISFTANGRAELKIVAADAVSNADGNATLSINPPIRNAPDNGAAIEIDDPKAIFGFINDPEGAVITPPVRGSFTFDLIEAFWV